MILGIFEQYSFLYMLQVCGRWFFYCCRYILQKFWFFREERFIGIQVVLVGWLGREGYQKKGVFKNSCSVRFVFNLKGIEERGYYDEDEGSLRGEVVLDIRYRSRSRGRSLCYEEKEEVCYWCGIVCCVMFLILYRG